MQKKTRIENLEDSNIEDLIYVCSSQRLDDPVHQQGVKLKRRWLHEMLGKYGSIAKIAYYEDKPVAQILYYPEESEKTKKLKRKGVLVVGCIYNPVEAAQKLGIGTKLLQSLIRDAKQRKTCLGNKPCRFILAKAFDTGTFLSMPEFYKKRGFLPTAEQNLFYLPIEGNYEPAPPIEKYKSLPEDKGKAIIFFGPGCQFGYPFARKIEELVQEVAPSIKLEMINEWERPEESIKRGNWWLIVNARPIQTFFMGTEKFKEEIKQAVSQNQ
jgi:GNAT superfamily N-acetyltransferase